MKTLNLAIALLALVVAPSIAKAEMILQLGTGGTVAGISTSFNSSAGSQLVLDVWVTQRGLFNFAGSNFGDYRLSNDGASSTGLSTFTYDVTSSDTGSTFNLGSITSGPGFNQANMTTTRPGAQDNAARINGFANETTPGSAVALPVYASETFRPLGAAFNSPNTGTVENNSIRLGTVTLSIASNASAPFTLTASSPFTGAANDPLSFGTGSSYITPGFVFGPLPFSATINVSAVPEPTTWLFGTVLVGFGAKRFRKRLAGKRAKG